MAEERKNSAADVVETGASAAHTIKGAIKAGKAISGAAKGAAAGGPYGAVAGAVWAGRKHIGKIIAVIVILLLLPVLFVLMLPGLIFGGLVDAFSPADSEAPILNSETAIVENANDITFAINSILGEALDDVMSQIEDDFASSGADHMEVKNSYSSGPVFNANLIVSQYCAARDEDFESISLDDLSAVLKENAEHLYTYTSKQESREVTTTDPKTGAQTTSTETWMVYTIRYNGEAYPELKYPLVLQLVNAAAKLVDFVILDCSSNMTNVFTPAAIESGDLVVRILTPDLKGINYLKAHQPLLGDERFHYNQHMTFAGMARPFHALDEMGHIIGGFDGLLPYSKEIDRCATEGGMFQAIKYCNPKYTASLNKVLDALEQMELAEQAAEDALDEEDEFEEDTADE